MRWKRARARHHASRTAVAATASCHIQIAGVVPALRCSMNCLAGEVSMLNAIAPSLFLLFEHRGEEAVGVVDVRVEMQIVARALHLEALAVEHRLGGHEREVGMRGEEGGDDI